MPSTPSFNIPPVFTPTVAGGAKKTNKSTDPNILGIKRPRGRVIDKATRARYADIARQAARRHGVPEDLFVAQIQQESGFNPDSVSAKGARGIAQIMPNFHPNINPDDIPAALDYAAKLLAGHRRNFGGWDLALAAYNAGSGAVKKYGGIPPYRETQEYVRKIMGSHSLSSPPIPEANRLQMYQGDLRLPIPPNLRSGNTTSDAVRDLSPDTESSVLGFLRLLGKLVSKPIISGR
jgi:hypothetical protein